MSRVSEGETYVNTQTGTGTVDFPIKPISHPQAYHKIWISRRSECSHFFCTGNFTYLRAFVAYEKEKPTSFTYLARDVNIHTCSSSNQKIYIGTFDF
jgi:hypothetical protein